MRRQPLRDYLHDGKHPVLKSCLARIRSPSLLSSCGDKQPGKQARRRAAELRTNALFSQNTAGAAGLYHQQRAGGPRRTGLGGGAARQHHPGRLAVAAQPRCAALPQCDA